MSHHWYNTHMAAPKPGTYKCAQVLTECVQEISIYVDSLLFMKNLAFGCCYYTGKIIMQCFVLVCFL